MSGDTGYQYVCPSCGFATGTPGPLWRCPRCGIPLELEPLLKEGRLEGIPRFYMGEGRAPLVEYGSFTGTRVVLSLEYLNPTGSFKDLGTSVVVGHMRSLGVKTGVVDSSGNSAISFSYYARAAGLEPMVVVPRDAPRGKLGLIRASGARVLTAGSREEAGRLAAELAGKGVYYAGHTLNPFFVAGVALRFYKLYEELSVCEGDGDVSIIVPLSSGSLVLGAWYAFNIYSRERGCQGTGISVWGVLPACLYEPSYKGSVERVVDLSGKEGCSMLDALRIPRPPRLAEVLKAIGSGGLFLVDDATVREWWPRSLSAGFLVEPSSSVVLAAVEWVASRRLGGTVVGVLTGSGLKYVDRLRGMGGGG